MTDAPRACPVDELAAGDSPRLLAVVAHPDDETFGCGGLLLRAAASGVSTAVACATRGEAGDAAVPVHPPHTLADVREAELREAARLLGVRRVDLLGLADSGMSGAAPPGSLAVVALEEVVASLHAVVDEVDPHVLLTLDASDGHRDHQRVREATVAVGRARGVTTYLSCLPRSLMRAWAGHMAAAHRQADYLALGELGTPDEDIDVVLDETPHVTARERAIAAHRSQTSPFEGLPADLRHAFLARDHLVRVPPG